MLRMLLIRGGLKLTPGRRRPRQAGVRAGIRESGGRRSDKEIQGAGSRIRNVLPCPMVLYAWIVPLWCSMMDRVIASPSRYRRACAIWNRPHGRTVRTDGADDRAKCRIRCRQRSINRTSFCTSCVEIRICPLSGPVSQTGRGCAGPDHRSDRWHARNVLAGGRGQCWRAKQRLFGIARRSRGL